MYRIIKLILLCLIPVATLGYFNNRINDSPANDNPEEFRGMGKNDNTNPHEDIVCLIYHRFGDSRYPSTNISTQLFKTQLQYLKDQKFNVITFGEAVKMISDHVIIPDKTLVITIDDGFSSFMENGKPLLNKFGYKATLFVNTKTVGAGDYMDWRDLRDLLKDGFEIGNHSHSHAYFLNHKEDGIKFFKEDIEHSQKLLKDSLGIEPDIMAYTYGEYDNEMIEAVKTMGFKAAAAQNSGVFCETTSLYSIPRFPINEQYGNITMFIEKVNMKAIRVLNAGELSTLYDKNPPVLTISLPSDNYDLAHIQGFIQGGEPRLNIKTDDSISVRLTSDRKLSARRVLYTLTVQDKNSKQWYWYSHLWINPNMKE